MVQYCVDLESVSSQIQYKTVTFNFVITCCTINFFKKSNSISYNLHLMPNEKVKKKDQTPKDELATIKVE